MEHIGCECAWRLSVGVCDAAPHTKAARVAAGKATPMPPYAQARRARVLGTGRPARLATRKAMGKAAQAKMPRAPTCAAWHLATTRRRKQVRAFVSGHHAAAVDARNATTTHRSECVERTVDTHCGGCCGRRAGSTALLATRGSARGRATVAAVLPVAFAMRLILLRDFTPLCCVFGQ